MATPSNGMTQNANRTRLGAAALFSPMDAHALHALERAGERRLFVKGQELEIRGEDHLLVLLSGAVALSVREADRAAIFSTYRAPSALNLACVMARASCQIRWRALEDGVVLILPGAVFREALAADTSLAARAYAELASAHQQLLSGAAGQRLQSAQRRVVGYLLSLASEPGGDALVRLPYEKHLLASLLGMTPENFSRALGRLAEHGVSVRGTDIHINQIERLRAASISM